jgi:DNA-binding NtrC family response regulator
MESEPGQGARFDIYLPRVEQPVAAVPPPSEPSVEAARGTETILLVEDEDAVREMTTEILERQGYTVLPSPHPREALFVAQRHGGPIQLMLTDVVMPEMNGRDLARRMAELRPSIRVLYMSGYTDEALGHHGVLEKDIAFIGKPFTPVRLCQRVREVLDGGDVVASAPQPAGAPDVR